MSNEKDAKLKALKLTLDKLDKTYGKGTVMKMGDAAVEDMESYSNRFFRFRCCFRGRRLSKRESCRNIWA